MSIMKNLRKKLGGALTLRQRIVLLFAVFFLLASLVAVVTIHDRSGLTLFTRWFRYDNENTSNAFSHGTRSESLFSDLDHNLLVCSDTLLQLFSPTGDTLIKEVVSFSDPALSSNGKQAVVYGVGGQNLYVIGKEKIAFTLTLPAGEYILSATINQSGWLAVTTKEDAYKGVVTVYNASYKPRVSIRLSSIYLSNAIVTPDCKGFYSLSPGQSGGIFESKLLYYDLNHAEEPVSQISLGDNVVLSMQTGTARCWVLSESELSLLLPSGELAAKYSYDGKYLKRGSLSGNNFATLLLSNSPSGDSGTLLTIDAEGTVLGSVDFSEQVLALSAAGRYVAVLTPSSLHVYTKDLTEIHVTDQVQGISNLVLYSDVTLSLIADELARRYLP